VTWPSQSVSENSSFGASGYAALLCGRAAPFWQAVKAFSIFFAGGAAEPRVSAVFTHTLPGHAVQKRKGPVWLAHTTVFTETSIGKGDRMQPQKHQSLTWQKRA